MRVVLLCFVRVLALISETCSRRSVDFDDPVRDMALAEILKRDRIPRRTVGNLGTMVESVRRTRERGVQKVGKAGFGG